MERHYECFVAKVEIVSLNDNGSNSPVKKSQCSSLFSALNADMAYVQELLRNGFCSLAIRK